MAKPWGNVSTCAFWEVLHADPPSSLVAVGMCSRPIEVRCELILYRHIHVSLRDMNGKSLFAVSEEELKTGRANAQYEDTKFLSQEGEWFLAGVLDGLPDSKFSEVCPHYSKLITTVARYQSCPRYVFPASISASALNLRTLSASSSRPLTATSGSSAARRSGRRTRSRTATTRARPPCGSSPRPRSRPPRRASRCACPART